MAAVLKGPGGYRVLPRLEPMAGYLDVPREPTFIGLVVDMETASTNFAVDDVRGP
jgi:DNA polymerase-3 subunit epsilon